MRRVLPLVLTLVLLAASCATTRETPRYFTLDMRPSGATPMVERNLRVDRLRPSPSLVRRNLLIKTTPTQVEYYALDEWAAGVADLVGEKIEAEFSPHDPGKETLILSGVILAFEQVDVPDGAEAHIKLDIAIRPEAERREPPILRRVYDTRVPAAAPRPEAVVEALSEGLELLTAEIAADLNELL